LKLLDSFSDSHFSQFFQEKIISRKEFPAKITRTDVFWVIYRNSQGDPVLGWCAGTTGAQHHLKSSRALYEMPTAMEYLISLLHDACSWVMYELSSNNNASNTINIHKGIRLLTSVIHG
jgi:hypothetical protein